MKTLLTELADALKLGKAVIDGTTRGLADNGIRMPAQVPLVLHEIDAALARYAASQSEADGDAEWLMAKLNDVAIGPGFKVTRDFFPSDRRRLHAIADRLCALQAKVYGLRKENEHWREVYVLEAESVADQENQ